MKGDGIRHVGGHEHEDAETRSSAHPLDDPRPDKTNAREYSGRPPQMPDRLQSHRDDEERERVIACHDRGDPCSRGNPLHGEHPAGKTPSPGDHDHRGRGEVVGELLQ